MIYSNIVLMTDFGYQDTFVGVLKGVIASISPGCVTIDLTHEIPQGDIRRAGIMLWQAQAYFSDGTIFLVVVDPGVGTERIPVIVRSANKYFVGPDNGLFTFITTKEYQVWQIENEKYQFPVHHGPTFHGRDIFAPVAAYLSKGVPCEMFGRQYANLKRLCTPTLEWNGNNLFGELLHADKFGNLLTSLGVFCNKDGMTWRYTPWIGNGEEAIISLTCAYIQLETPTGRKTIPMYNTFADIPQGELGALVGSSGLIEIAAKQDNAENLLGYIENRRISMCFDKVKEGVN